MLQAEVLFADRYRLIKCIGRGGFAEVWLAEDNWTNLQIAIKVYAPGQGLDQGGLREFCEEIASVYDLNHANLLKPQHVDTWENMPYLIMAYCPAGSCVKRVGKMTEAELWKLIHDVAAGLAYLHGKNVIHQDIKPDNILIDEDGHFLITDFGISTRARSTLQKSVVGSSFSHGSGTVAYMGPERFSRQPAPTKASDIWSFGAMVFELLEGIAPFGMHGGGMQKSGAEIPFINANVSDALKFTTFKMLSKETWDRPTASTLVEWANNPNTIRIDYNVITCKDYSSSLGNQMKQFGDNKEGGLTLSVSPQELKIPAEGDFRVIFVHTNGEWIFPRITDQQWIKTVHTSNNYAFAIRVEENKTGKHRKYVLPLFAHSKTDRKYVNIVIAQPSEAKKNDSSQTPTQQQLQNGENAKTKNANGMSTVDYFANKIYSTFTNEGYNVKIKQRDTILSAIKGEEGKYVRISKGGFLAALLGFRNEVVVEIFINTDGEFSTVVGCNYNVWPLLLCFAEGLTTVVMVTVTDDIGLGWALLIIFIMFVLLQAHIRTISKNMTIIQKARNCFR